MILSDFRHRFLTPMGSFNGRCVTCSFHDLKDLDTWLGKQVETVEFMALEQADHLDERPPRFPFFLFLILNLFRIFHPPQYPTNRHVQAHVGARKAQSRRRSAATEDGRYSDFGFALPASAPAGPLTSSARQ